MAGAFGSTASMAGFCPGQFFGGSVRNIARQRHRAYYVSSEGACEMYIDRIFSFEARNSSRVARIISMNFSPKVRDSFLARRIVCMVRVLPPLTMRLFFRFW